MGGSKIALRTEEEQQAAAREREERERRDARRKSLANRRVSFAAEATLHTFALDDFQDPTTSTEASRRASRATNNTQQSQAEDETTTKHRRSSGLPVANFDQRDDDTATTIYSSDSEPADVVEEVIEEEEDSNSDSSDDGTMMSVTTEEVTGTSVGSLRSEDGQSDGGNNSTLDEVLRQAARQAGTQSLGADDTEEEIDEDEEVIPSFGWIKKSQPAQRAPVVPAPATTPAPQPVLEDDTEPAMDMDMTSAVGGILNPNAPQDKFQEEDMSMDVTQVYGGILDQQKQPTPDDEDEQDATMEMTQAIGGIRSYKSDGAETDNDDNEDMSMELTTVMGGVVGKKRQSLRRKSVNQANEDATMDMTTGLGRIVIASDAPDDGEANDDGEATMGMDMTAAIGGILNNDTQEPPRDLNKSIMVEEASKPNSPEQAIEAAVSRGSPKRRSPGKSTAPVQNDENEDPGLSAFQGPGLRRRVGPSTLPRDDTLESRTPSPEKPATPRSTRRSPRKQTRNAQPPRSVSRSASKTPSPQKDSSPVRLSPVKRNATPSPQRDSNRTPRLFNNGSTDRRTPSVVLTPQRRLSGMGVDREGLGSPKITAMFDRRESLGDAATEFVPGKRTVAFQDPQEMAAEVDRDRQQEEDRENDRAILEREADGEGTFNLREMIDNLSPKRKPLKGRKSLHVGSAAGVLGKRPFELEDDEDSDEEQDGIKRLKGHQGSPVKNVRLQNPPSAFETTGHLMRTSQISLEQPGSASTPSLSSPTKKGRETPKNQLRFKNVDDEPTTREVNFYDSPTKDAAQLEAEAEEGRIHLQHFLNMTSIRFMELTTTKRRHTAAPSAFLNGHMVDDGGEASLERCVVAGACTVPNLELYQHSCRELKKYISEGRRIVKEIERDTFEENPPLFREYITAAPDVKALMDNQFKNVKTHARLLSKAMWYEWRMKLQDGLKEGLVKITEGMDDDERVLQKQQELLASVMTDVVSRYESLLEESQDLEEAARELADSDPADLQATRDELTGLELDIEAKKKLIAELRQQYDESEVEVLELSATKEDCLSDIRESERIREECRGWTSAEIDSFSGKLYCSAHYQARLTKIERVTAIENAHGWTVAGISGSDLSMTYLKEIELIFDTAAFQSAQTTSRIDLHPIGEDNASNPLRNREFFVNCIRDYVQGVSQSSASVSQMLRMVSAAWDKARLVFAQIQSVNINSPTKVHLLDSKLCISSSIMLPPLQTRVEVDLALSGVAGEDGLDFGIASQARVVYGETFNVEKIEEYLSARIGSKVGGLDEEWSDVLIELRERLIARGRKQ